MSRTLTPASNLETLRKEAKRWLKALRAGDAQALARWRVIQPVVPAAPGLRDVQLALAREYGFPGWAALKAALEDAALARRSRSERADELLRHHVWSNDPLIAARIVARHPDVARENLYTAIATGDLAGVQRRLASDPAAASRAGGPLSWAPLLYLAYSRVSDGNGHAPAIARLLLDLGADPNARFNDGWDNPFTVLTGVIGEGEGDKPPHPQAEALASLLIERGADPYDTQALYNTSITRDDTRWLDFLWSRCEQRGETAKWRAIPAGAIGGVVPMCALDYLIGNAVAFNHLRRAEWLLMHGANADGVHAYSQRLLREEALIYGNAAMADLLVRYGATEKPLQGQVAFQSACMRLDRDAARALAAQHPECLGNADPMLIAARKGRADIVALLLDLGMHVDVADETGQRGLHNAVGAGAIDVVRLLVAHGADIDRPTTRFGGGMGFAAHFGRREVAEFLAPLSRDVLNLTYMGMKDRLHELFVAEPELINAQSARSGVTPLFALPDDEEMAVEMTEFLLAHGADPGISNKAGFTAEHDARQRGLEEAADLMAEHLRGG